MEVLPTTRVVVVEGAGLVEVLLRGLLRVPRILMVVAEAVVVVASLNYGRKIYRVASKHIAARRMSGRMSKGQFECRLVLPLCLQAVPSIPE